MPRYQILFRTCDIVHSLHNAPRPFDLDKRTLIKVCFRSLVEALRPVDHRIVIIADRLSPEMTTFFESFRDQGHEIEMVHGEYGNDNSLRKQVELALTVPDDDWVYFVEDDYVHTPEAFVWMNDLIENKDQYITKKTILRQLKFWKTRLDQIPIVIHTPDYPDRYLPRYLRPSLIFLGKHCHWRQITNTTFTFLIKASSVKRYKDILYYSCNGADDGYLSRALYGGLRFGDKALCLSPIPGVSTHMHDGVMTPLVDWASIVDRHRGS